MRRSGVSKKAVAVLVLIVLVIVAVAVAAWRFYDRRSRGENVRQFYTDVGAGWNLGNSLDVHNLHVERSDPAYYETYWNNPATTPELFAQVKAAGFRTVRIPVTWYVHADDDFNIDEAWMQRVQTVVDYALDSGLNVILNAHHDNWFFPPDNSLETATANMQKLWTQIAVRFADYDKRLLFESMNEPRLIGTDDEWTDGTREARETVNALNAVFVQTVRAAGGGNAERYLLIPTYCAGLEDAALEALVVPADKNIAVSVHLYAPYQFAHEDGNTDEWHADARADTKKLEHIFAQLHELFIRRGVPVVITEFGAVDKDNTEYRKAWTAYVVRSAAERNIPCIWWDAGGNGKRTSYRLLDRYSLTWVYPEIAQCIVDNTY